MTDGTTLRVTMLGGFALQYGPEPVRLKKRQSAKPVRLLQMLIYRRASGISRQGLIDALYGAETGVETANNLNATVSQLRRLLRDTILPEENYICTEVDRYRFQSSFPVLADTEEVLILRQKASEAAGEERMGLLQRLCALYRGRFLPELDGESWVETARSYYQRIYQESLEELCRMLWERREYQTVLRLTDYAATLFPFEEWQAWQYECLLARGRMKDAQELYREVEKLYLNELAAPPPERMLQRIRTSAGDSLLEEHSVRTIRDRLDEAGREGPYCLPFPSFLDAYQLISRMSGAAGQPVSLMLCTLRSSDSRSRPDRELFRAAMEQLEAALCQTLRQEDAFTRYSRSQYLLVLIGMEEAACGTISRRVSEQFRRTAGGQRLVLDCQAVSSEYVQGFGGSGQVKS